jgi:transposase
LSAHLQNTGSPDHLGHPLGRLAQPQKRRGLIERFEHACVQQTIAGDLALVAFYAPRLAELERSIEQTAHRHDPVALARLRTSPGVGTILALVRLDELEAIARCPRVQAFGSSCRLVTRARASHGTRHGPSGQTSGNAHLPWAFPDAAVLVLKHHEPAHQSLARLATQHGTGKARALLARQRARAVSCRLKPHVACDPAKCLATSGWRARTNLASHWSQRGQRRTPFAATRAIRRVGHEPAPAVPGPHGTPGILLG